MSRTKTIGNVVSVWLLAALAMTFVSGKAAFAQDAPATDAPAATAEPADAEPPAVEAAADAPAENTATENTATENTATETIEVPLPADGAGGDDGAGDAGADAEAEGVGLPWTLLVLATLVVPVLVANWIAARIKMPEHGWKLATVLTSVAVGALAVGYAANNNGFKGGPDLAGGITLLFETDKAALAQEDGKTKTPTADEMEDQVGAIKLRVDPAGTKEITIRRSGADRIEIIVPKQSQAELASVKKQITDLGNLEFRIVADPTWPADEALIKAALKASPSQKLIAIGGKKTGRWVPFKEEGFRGEQLITRQVGSRREALVKGDPFNVTGEYLSNVRKGYGEQGYIVEFFFDSKGAQKFGRLTGANLPSASGGQRRLGIMLNGVLTSAPAIRSKIGAQGEISGIGTEQDVDDAVRILKAGALPIPLNKSPLSEQVISPAIGAETVEKGTYAITVSLIAVLVFMLIYYRFAGVVACLALLTNILLVLAVMVMMNAAFTLPGLAGLVLTVGMSVDANVLIFERIREELKRGAALRMAIRNGFDRATTTIVDANLTTLITGIVLYTIGTDQIRGFAVTLVLGILMSMYTAIFASRVLFEIAERRRWITGLSFSSIVGATSINFLGKRGLAAIFSIALIGVGLTAVAQRGIGLLNIDFTGGTSITTIFNDAATSIADVRATLDGFNDGEGFGNGDYTVVELGQGEGRYAVDSSIENVEEAEQMLTDVFGDALKTFTVDVGDVEEFTEDDVNGVRVPVVFNEGEGFEDSDGLAHDALLERIAKVAESLGKPGLEPTLENPEYVDGSSQRFKDWTIKAFDLSAENARALAEGLKSQLESQPLFPTANKISGKVAGDLQLTAVFAILLSLVGIVGYLWFRFQNVSFGLAAVVALVHDVLVTLGAIALSAWLVSSVPSLATALQLDAFQISLPIVAAFLTIIGYSLNDTIVVFDRIREVRGKSPELTAGMINTSINQTLARTLLTSLTTLLVVGILYFFGGAGIHAFAFALVVGVIVGTYSSIFIASPALLAMVGKSEASNAA